jgi:phosphonate transport system substrate-binding protein
MYRDRPGKGHIVSKKLLWFWLVCAMAAVLANCTERGASKKISLEKREEAQQKTERPRAAPLRIAVGGMITPKEGFVYYKEFLDYLGKKLGRPVEFVDREKYDEINDMVRNEQLDVAFVCGGPYVDGHDEFGMELLAAPQAYGKAVYYSYIIVAKDSPLTSFAELRGRTFAFADPLSNSGKLVPEYMLARMGETPDTFFKKYIYTYAHDKSIKAVAQGIVDGAAVDSLIWEYAARVNPEFTSKTKIIVKSPPYGVPPIVVRKGLPAALKKQLRDLLLNANQDSEGRKLLAKMMIDRFVRIDDSAYDTIREMKTWIAAQKGKEQKTH